MTKVRIVGGMSLPGRIALHSQTHVAIATHKGDGEVELRVRRRLVAPVADSTLERYTPWTIRMIRHFLGDMTPRDRTQFLIAGAVIYLLDRAGFMATGPGLPGWLVNALGLLVLAGFVYLTRPWHAAEHMAVESYANGEGSARHSDIARADRVSPRCGGRFVLPFIILAFVWERLLGYTGLSERAVPYVAMILTIEVAFAFDKLVGWYKVPVFREASQLLQCHLTTAAPGALPLYTAEIALVGLINAAERVGSGEDEMTATFLTGSEEVHAAISQSATTAR